MVDFSLYSNNMLNYGSTGYGGGCSGGGWAGFLQAGLGCLLGGTGNGMNGMMGMGTGGFYGGGYCGDSESYFDMYAGLAVGSAVLQGVEKYVEHRRAEKQEARQGIADKEDEVQEILDRLNTNKNDYMNLTISSKYQTAINTAQSEYNTASDYLTKNKAEYERLMGLKESELSGDDKILMEKYKEHEKNLPTLKAKVDKAIETKEAAETQLRENQERLTALLKELNGNSIEGIKIKKRDCTPEADLKSKLRDGKVIPGESYSVEDYNTVCLAFQNAEDGTQQKKDAALNVREMYRGGLPELEKTAQMKQFAILASNYIALH